MPFTEANAVEDLIRDALAGPPPRAAMWRRQVEPI